MPEKKADNGFAVVIPVKDRFPELLQTLASVYAQSLLPQEVIIIDDSSSVPLTEALLPSPPHPVKLKIFRNDVNVGAAKSLNQAVLKTEQPFVAFIDSDDCYLDKALEKMAAFWSAAPEDVVALAIGFYWCTYDLTPYRTQMVKETVTREALLAHGNFLGGTSAMCVRRSAYLAVGGHPEMNGSYDYGMWLKLSSIGQIKTIPEPLLLYRSPSTNPLPTYTKNYRKQFLAIRQLYKQQSRTDQALMKPRMQKIVLGHLSKWGRKRFALAVLFLIYKEERRMDHFLFSQSIILLFGARAYDQFLYFFAHFRAFFFSRSPRVRIKVHPFMRMLQGVEKGQRG